jgi:hypothetical protein
MEKNTKGVGKVEAYFHNKKGENIRVAYHGKGKSKIEAGFWNGQSPKGHEVNNMFIRLVSFDGLETGFDMTLDEAATIISFLAICLEEKLYKSRKYFAPEKTKKV